MFDGEEQKQSIMAWQVRLASGVQADITCSYKEC